MARYIEDDTEVVEQEEVVDDTPAESTTFGFKFTQIVWILLGVLEVLLALRLFFRVIAANASNAFVSLVYAVTYPFVWPFFGIVREPAANGSVLEVGTLIAMAVWALVAWVIVRILWVALYQPRATRIRRGTHTHA